MPLWLACVLLLADLIALVYFRRQLREKKTMRVIATCVCGLLAALLLLYLFRAPVAAAYGGAAVGAVLFLIQLVVSFLLRRSGGDAVGLAAWIPGHGLFSSLQVLAAQVSAASILAFATDLALVLCNASTIFSCMGYVSALRQATERATQRQARQDAEKDFSLED